MAKRAKPGDVVELDTSRGAVFLQYLGKHRVYGDCVLVCPTEHDRGTVVSSEFFRDGYVAFFPVVAAVARGLASVVGHLPPAAIPKRLRRPGARSASKVVTWIIEDGTAEVVKRTMTVSERKLPIAVIWNKELLLERVSQGWRPELEGSIE